MFVLKTFNFNINFLSWLWPIMFALFQNRPEAKYEIMNACSFKTDEFILFNKRK